MGDCFCKFLFNMPAVFLNTNSRLFFHTSNTIVYHTWNLPRIFEFKLNSVSQIPHIAWRGDKNSFQVAPPEKKSQGVRSGDVGSHSTNDTRQQHHWQTFQEAYVLLLSSDVLELHPETPTNAGHCHRIDY